MKAPRGGVLTGAKLGEILADELEQEEWGDLDDVELRLQGDYADDLRPVLDRAAARIVALVAGRKARRSAI